MSAWNCISASFAAGAAVGEQRRTARSGVLAASLEDVADLVRDRLDARARQVRGRRAAGQAADQSARVGVPVRRAEAGERRHEVDAAGVGDRPARDRATRGAGSAQPEQLAEPLDGAAGDGDVAFERVRGVGAEGPGDRGRQAVARARRASATASSATSPSRRSPSRCPGQRRRDRRAPRASRRSGWRSARPRPGDRGDVWPNMPLDGRTCRQDVGRDPEERQQLRIPRAGSQVRSSCVREAFVASQAWTAPPVRFQSSQLSIVPAQSSPRSARASAVRDAGRAASASCWRRTADRSSARSSPR